MTKPPISEAHERLNQIRRWLKSNPHYFRPTHLVLLRSVIEDVATPEHVETLQAYMREWRLSDAEAAAQKATMDERIRQAEEERAAWLARKDEHPQPPYPASTARDGSEGTEGITPGHTPAPSLSTQPTEATI